ncbi:MAG: hypothetical protein Kow0069_37120 [Promethearchaeota archaeon]
MFVPVPVNMTMLNDSVVCEWGAPASSSWIYEANNTLRIQIDDEIHTWHYNDSGVLQFFSILNLTSGKTTGLMEFAAYQCCTTGTCGGTSDGTDGTDGTGGAGALSVVGYPVLGLLLTSGFAMALLRKKTPTKT